MLKFLLSILYVNLEVLNLLLNDARQFFSSNPDIIELRTYTSKKRILEEV